MKIIWQAYDTTNYTGGPIVNALRLLPEFKRRGHEVLAVVEYHRDHPNADKLREQGIECVTFPRPRFSEDHVKMFLEELIRFKPDVFVSNISAHAGLAGRWAQRWGVPVVHTHRSDDALNNGMAEFFFASDNKWQLSALVSVNRYLFDKIQSLTSKPIRHRIIPSGVPLSEHRATQAGVSRFRVAYAGRLVEKQKRISDVVRAFIRLADTEPDIDFSVIGHGDPQLESQLREEVAAMGLANRIQFMGRLHGEEYKRALASHQVIVLLSDYEGIPGSIMDGMSCGLVPVVHHMNGIDELVRHDENGVIVNDRSENFIKAIVRLRDDETLRQRLAQNALGTIRDRFSLAYAASEWESLFRELHEEFADKKAFPRKTPTFRIVGPHPLLLELNPRPGWSTRVVSRVKRLLGVS